MPETKLVPVSDLTLDLKNYRALPQKTEAASLQAIIAVAPDWFWGVLDSILEDGYLPTENVIVLSKGSELIVKEGNRRVGALKLALGQLKGAKIELPNDLTAKIAKLEAKWKSANKAVPCTVYPESEAKTVDRIVTLIHGKGQKAGRLPWEAVARARHNRDELKQSEPALDLLESYLKNGRNLTDSQKERWAGGYPVTVLEEAMKRIAPGVGAPTKDLAAVYPAKHRDAFEKLALDIGLGHLNFEAIRTGEVAKAYGFPPPPAAKGSGKSRAATGGTASATGAGGATAKGGSTTAAGTAKARGKNAAAATTDPRSVKRLLKQFRPRGAHREKLVKLLEEARALNVDRTPHAFCFVLRSMFELSAKAYCKDHASKAGPSTTDPKGNDRHLVDVLRDIVRHLTKNGTDKPMVKQLHGAMTELGTSTGILSVTSMNQLIHNPRFTVDGRHVCTIFGNVLPLLEEMNK